MNALEQRWHIFRLLAPYFGRAVPARFIQKTDQYIGEVTRVHNLIEGIYKPKESDLALTIASMLKNPYADHIEYNDDRSWYFFYSPKAGNLDSAVNQSLFNCMKLSEPVLVIKQLTNKTHKNGTTYKLLGLGLIEDFNPTTHLFKIRQVSIEQFQAKVDPGDILSDDLIEIALQLEALEAWSPFVAEDRAIYKVSKQKRDAAFRKIVLQNYSDTCAVLNMKFSYQNVVEVQAAHIIGKEVKGTDNPRNGLALSHTAHWAFDKGIFTISDQYEILVHPKAKHAKSQKFPIIELDRKRILLPSDESNYPHVEALRWHEKEVFGKFAADNT